jgi:hypothetical protein
MARSALLALFVLFVCADFVRGAPATTQANEPEVRSFELTPVAPPSPASKNTFQYAYHDRIPGNAAPIYLQAVLLMDPAAPDKANDASNAYSAKDFKTFEKLADELDMPAMLVQIEQAGRRMSCDFNPTLERGVMCLLPHLKFLAHGLERSLWMLTLREIEQGKIDDALLNLRRGYVLADNINEPVMVTALVSDGSTRMMNEALAVLLSHPNSPNLYWAIRELPPRRPTMRRAWDCERSWIFFQSEALKRFDAGESLTAEDWRNIMYRDMGVVFTAMEKTYDFKSMKEIPHPDPIKDAAPEVLKQAQAHYASTHKVSADQAAAVDPAIVLGEYYFHQFEVGVDRSSKLRMLPYDQLLPRIAEADRETNALRKNNPANPFLALVSTWQKAVSTFAKTDRQFAALAGVEAIRSYAAANGGALPKSLDDVTETPVPENPMTGKQFEYRVENGVATLADTQSEATLTYTIKIRK